MSVKIADKLGSSNRLQAEWRIRLWEDGSMSVEGPIEDKLFTLAVLENAKDAVKNHRNPNAVDVLIPGKDITL